jgi:serine/threonine protein kinase
LPHVLALQEVYTTKNNTYIITELCESDLNKTIRKGLSEAQATSFMQQILEGYQHFARKDIIHRDLKPANILITESRELKIADFGFAIKVADALTSNKYNVGSPLYMAPESLRKNEYTLKTDIWGLGIIYYEMLTGDTPWKAKN